MSKALLLFIEIQTQMTSLSEIKIFDNAQNKFKIIL